MKIIEIAALPNGAHRNQNGVFPIVPNGWAIIPGTIDVPNMFPFVNLTVVDGVCTGITENREAYEACLASAPASDDFEPSQLDRIEAQAMYTALMTDTLMEEEV